MVHLAEEAEPANIKRLLFTLGALIRGHGAAARDFGWLRAPAYFPSAFWALLALPAGARLRLGDHAGVEITGLRNPCVQIDRFQPGLMAAVLDRAADGSLVRKAGVMGVVRVGGDVRPGDTIRVELPAGPHRALGVV